MQFLLRIEDVTKEVMDSLQGLNGMDRMQRQQKVIMSINSRLSDTAQSVEARVSSLFKGNQFLVFRYQRYRDVRLVMAPPENLGRIWRPDQTTGNGRVTPLISLFFVHMQLRMASHQNIRRGTFL